MISMARWEWWVRWHLIIEGDPLLCSPHPQDPLLSSPYPLAPHIFAYMREISWPRLRPLPHHICHDFKNFLTNDKLMPLLPMSGQWQTGKNFSATGRDSRPPNQIATRIQNFPPPFCPSLPQTSTCLNRFSDSFLRKKIRTTFGLKRGLHTP